ncbi:hypothetical protein, partial [Spongiimicrobium sp. 2-473A-2-J]|uniref:hypothetical protein n=1 Tax=Eudoraea algarum TaxID=3417568 RepID=UPI003D362797
EQRSGSKPVPSAVEVISCRGYEVGVATARSAVEQRSGSKPVPSAVEVISCRGYEVGVASARSAVEQRSEILKIGFKEPFLQIIDILRRRFDYCMLIVIQQSVVDASG